MNLEQLAKEVIEKGKAATPRPWRTDPTDPFRVEQAEDGRPIGDAVQIVDCWYQNAEFISAAGNIATPLAQAFLELKEAAKAYVEGEWGPISPEMKAFLTSKGMSAAGTLAATIERIEKPL